MLTPKEIASIIINVIFVASFLSIFFFTYASKVEKSIVENQIDYLVKNITDDIYLLPQEDRQELKELVSKFQLPNMESVDQQASQNNEAIIIKTSKMIAIGLIVSLIGLYFISKKYNFSAFNVIKENLIILLFIGLTEFTFLNLFGRNYMSVRPNQIKLALVNKLAQIKL